MPADGSALDLPAMATNVGVQTTAPKDYTLPDIVIIGGPNGAGKTTAAQQLMPKDLELREFLNADEVARGLSPFNAEHMAIMAGRVMIERMRDLVYRQESFAFETTCAGRSHLPLLRRCRADGWQITLLFLYLASPDAALQRVARRVRQGGHNIPPDAVIRRYWSGLVRMRLDYLPLADLVAIYDNSDGVRVLIAERRPESGFVVRDTARWAIIEGAKPWNA